MGLIYRRRYVFLHVYNLSIKPIFVDSKSNFVSVNVGYDCLIMTYKIVLSHVAKGSFP